MTELLAANVERLGVGQPARALPAGHASGRRHPAEPRAVRHRGHAEAAGRVPGHAIAGGARGGRRGGTVSDGAARRVRSTPRWARSRSTGRRRRARSSCVYLHSAQGEAAGHGAARRIWPTPVRWWPRCSPASAPPRGSRSIDDIEDAAFHLLDVMDRLGFAIVRHGGLSLGGWMAAELAVRWPERVRRMVLVNPSGSTSRARRSPRSSAGTVRARRRALRRSRLPPRPAHAGHGRHGGGPVTRSPSSSCGPSCRRRPRRRRWDGTPTCTTPSCGAAWAASRLPRSSSTPARTASSPGRTPQAYASAIPDAVVAELDDAAHMAVLERPAELSKLVLEHLGS